MPEWLELLSPLAFFLAAAGLWIWRTEKDQADAESDYGDQPKRK